MRPECASYGGGQMTERIRKAYPLAAPKAHKYHAKRSGKYASKREEKRAWELRILADTGAITDLQEQVPFVLLPSTEDFPRPLRYFADFVYTEGSEVHIEDAKGFQTPEYRIKRRLMKQLLGLEITEI